MTWAASLRDAARRTLVYFGLAEEAGKRDEVPRDVDTLGSLIGTMSGAALLGSRRGAVAAVIVALCFVPTFVAGRRASHSPAHRRAETLAAAAAIFSLVTLVLSRHASIWIPISAAAAFVLAATLRETKTRAAGQPRPPGPDAPAR